jgi:hypothetical protein
MRLYPLDFRQTKNFMLVLKDLHIGDLLQNQKLTFGAEKVTVGYSKCNQIKSAGSISIQI